MNRDNDWVPSGPATAGSDTSVRHNGSARLPAEQLNPRISGRVADILLNATVLIVPMCLFSAVLLGLVFHYRVVHNPPLADEFSLPGESDEAGVFYVRLNATYIIFIASWSSTLAPMLVTSVCTLMSYPVARTVLRGTRSAHTRALRLPTPYQLALTIGLVGGGGMGQLRKWLDYLKGWKTKRQPQGKALSSIAYVVVLVTFLHFLVFLADTWLHVTTTTTSFVQTAPLNDLPLYSFRLSASCLNTSGESMGVGMQSGCTLNPAATAIFLLDGSVAISVLGNASTTYTASTFESEIPYVYLGVPPSPALAALDYRATSYGVQTQCSAVSNQCNLNAFDGAETPYYCNAAFQGDVTQDTWQMYYFTDATMTNNDTTGGVTNPYYFGWAALLNPEGGGTLAQTNLTAIPEIVTPVHGGTAIVLACNTTAYDVAYDSVNGTITRLVSQLSNNSIADMVSSSLAYTNAATPYLQQYASLATFSATAQEMADKMALAYSKAAISLFSQAVVPQPALQAQERASFLVARIPAAPLYSLVVANLLFVVIGIILLVVSLGVSGDEMKEIQTRLSIAGLVAERFERKHGKQPVRKIENLFEENTTQSGVRVGLDRSAMGGYEYKIFDGDEGGEHGVEMDRLL